MNHFLHCNSGPAHLALVYLDEYYNMSRHPDRRGFVVERPDAIRLLASPLRQAIVDSIVADGETTANALSAVIRRPADRLYYHLRLLEKAGLVRSRESRATNGRTERFFDVPDRPLYLRYDPASSANRSAVRSVVRSMVRAALHDFARGFERKGVSTWGPRRELWAGRVQGHLTTRDLEVVNAVMQCLIDRIVASRRHDPASGKAYQLTWLLSPMEDG